MTQKKLYFGTNLKMYQGIASTVRFLTDIKAIVPPKAYERFELFVIPSFTALDRAGQLLLDTPILLGAQNISWAEQGQFTGEISASMLKEVGAVIAEIGHSERRHVLHETDEEENAKVLCALRNGLRPLLCIGETEQQKEDKITAEVLRSQLKLGLRGVSPEEVSRLLIAYEPVWAIGVSGKPATKEYAEQVHYLLRQTLAELFGSAYAAQIPLLYGGSVTPTNAAELIMQPHIDGLFVGRSAWSAEGFTDLLQIALAAVNEKLNEEDCL